MDMQVKLHKGSGKPNTLACVRDDGSTTGTRLNLPVEHDLCHYAVEKTLGIREAFYGLVVGGMDIRDFNAPGMANSVPREAIYTEFIVGLLQIEMSNGAPYADFHSELVKACTTTGRKPLPAPRPGMITNEQADQIRQEIGRLMHDWQTLDPGQTLELEF